MKLRISFFPIFLLLIATRGYAQWDSTSAPFGNSYVYATGNIIFAAGISPGNAAAIGTLSRSSNNGDSWQLDTTDGSPLFNAFVTIGSNIFLGTGHSFILDSVISPGGVRLSTDEGLTWQARDSTIPDTGEIDVVALAVDGNTLLRGSENRALNDTNSGLFASSDLGATWNQLVNGRSVTAIGVSGGNLITTQGVPDLVGPNHTLLSSDNGFHWVPVSGIPDTDFIEALGAVRGNLVGSSNQGGLFVSTDNGLSWSTATGSGIDTSYVSAFATAGNTIFSAASAGLFRSTDKGFTWISINDGLGTDLYLSGIATNSTYLFIEKATSSLWRRSLSQLGVSALAPSSQLSMENYPNPFDRSTTIEFNLPNPSYVTLRVYNALGVQVCVLADGFMQAGDHQINFPGADVPAGMYVYRLTAGAYSMGGPMSIEHSEYGR